MRHARPAAPLAIHCSASHVSAVPSSPRHYSSPLYAVDGTRIPSAPRQSCVGVTSTPASSRLPSFACPTFLLYSVIITRLSCSICISSIYISSVLFFTYFIYTPTSDSTSSLLPSSSNPDSYTAWLSRPSSRPPMASTLLCPPACLSTMSLSPPAPAKR